MEPIWLSPFVIRHSARLASSYLQLTGNPLCDREANKNEIAFELYHSPYALVSHGTEPDPVFNYANLTAQRLWKMNWEAFTVLPSRLSAESVEESKRRDFIEHARKKGVIENYSGIRITSENKRFEIKNVTLWNVLDESGIYLGQAACFSQWKFLD